MNEYMAQLQDSCPPTLTGLARHYHSDSGGAVDRVTTLIKSGFDGRAGRRQP